MVPTDGDRSSASASPSLALLRTLALFARSSDGELAHLSKLFVAMERGADERVLFDIGQPADAMYLITEGTAFLESSEDETTRLHPPALLGELGALTGVARSTKVTVRDAVCFRVDALEWQKFLFEHHDVGLRVLRDVLRVAAEKIHRDQVRIGTMRQTAQWTQSELKEVLSTLSALPGTPELASVRGSVDTLVLRNRRQNLRVEPSPSMPATLALGHGSATVLDLSRTHLSFALEGPAWAAGEPVAGTLHFGHSSLPIRGHVIRAYEGRVTMALEAMSEDAAAPLDGYLTRAQLLDILL
jgi:CRP/FNR family transcriptional regulator, cyclic AMP receptor protein